MSEEKSISMAKRALSYAEYLMTDLNVDRNKIRVYCGINGRCIRVVDEVDDKIDESLFECLDREESSYLAIVKDDFDSEIILNKDSWLDATNKETKIFNRTMMKSPPDLDTDLGNDEYHAEDATNIRLFSSISPSPLAEETNAIVNTHDSSNFIGHERTPVKSEHTTDCIECHTNLDEGHDDKITGTQRSGNCLKPPSSTQKCDMNDDSRGLTIPMSANHLRGDLTSSTNLACGAPAVYGSSADHGHDPVIVPSPTLERRLFGDEVEEEKVPDVYAATEWIQITAREANHQDSMHRQRPDNNSIAPLPTPPPISSPRPLLQLLSSCLLDFPPSLVALTRPYPLHLPPPPSTSAPCRGQPVPAVSVVVWWVRSVCRVADNPVLALTCRLAAALGVPVIALVSAVFRLFGCTESHSSIFR